MNELEKVEYIRCSCGCESFRFVSDTVFKGGFMFSGYECVWCGNGLLIDKNERVGEISAISKVTDGKNENGNARDIKLLSR